MVNYQKKHKRGCGIRSMNPNYMEQQENPDGKIGHDERNTLYTKHKKPKHDPSEVSERLFNKHLSADEQSLRDLQIEIHMNQCANKTEKCYDFENRNQCLECPQYKI